MKTRIIALAFLSILMGTVAPGCKKSSDEVVGCTDGNADNFDSKANKNESCRYRYASNIDVTNVPANKGDGTPWDDGDGPDIKVNFGKSSSSGYDHGSSTASDFPGGTATVTPSGNVMFTNETWKFEVVDVDLLSSEVIASGTFNPLKSVTNNTIEVVANGVTVKFKYTIK